MRNSYAVVFLCLIFCCKINAQKVSYSIRNDSIETITIDRIVNKLPFDKRNAYRKAIEMAFDEFWKDNKNKFKLPLKKLSKSNGKIDVLNAQIETLNTIAVKESLECGITTLNHEIDSLKREIAKIDNANDSALIVIEHWDSHGVEKRIVMLTDALVYGDSLKKMALCKMDTTKMGYAIRVYPILGEFYEEDSVEMRNRYETIRCYYPLASSVQQSVSYMSKSIYDETKSREYAGEINNLIKSSNLYSKKHTDECSDICYALNAMVIQTNSLSRIIDKIWRDYENGFPSIADLEKANILQNIINQKVGAATGGKTEYNKYFVNLNEVLNYLRDIFSPNKYSNNNKQIKDKKAMETTRKEINNNFPLL